MKSDSQQFSNKDNIKSDINVSLDSNASTEPEILPSILIEQDVFRIDVYPSNLIEQYGTLSTLDINLIIVTKHETLKIDVKNYHHVIKTVDVFSSNYDIDGLTEYIQKNYNNLILIGFEKLEEYYKTEKQMDDFKEIGNLVYSDFLIDIMEKEYEFY